MERREFMRKGGRFLLLGGMAAGSAYLVINGQVEKSATCKIASHCKGCSKLSACSDDQATDYRLTENSIK
jgi:hypothetical protein